MFFVSILLNQILSWVRMQSGTSSLRAILYMDEIFGIFPWFHLPSKHLFHHFSSKQGRLDWELCWLLRIQLIKITGGCQDRYLVCRTVTDRKRQGESSGWARKCCTDNWKAHGPQNYRQDTLGSSKQNFSYVQCT